MRIALPALLVFLAGCVDDLGSPTEIEDNRVLAARAVIAGMPDVAWAAPGEEVRVELLVVDEGAARPIGFHLEACVESDARVGASECTGAPLATAIRETPDIADPAIDFVAPDVDGNVLVRGIVCASAAAIGSTRCADPGARATLVRYSLRVVPAGEPRNHHPGLRDIALDGRAFPETPISDPSAGCDGTELPIVRAGAPAVPITFVASDEALEAFDSADGAIVETLQVSHHATAGELDQAFTFLDAERPRGEVEWTPPGPDDAPASGEIVRFWLIALDGRGGTGVSERALCLLPPAGP